MDERILKERIGLPLRCLDETDSTNRVALEWAKQGAPHGAMVIADRQTAGRGRIGRSFYSPQGGLYMSIILDEKPQAIGLLTTLCAVAVCRAVEKSCGKSLQIKWVNDCMLKGRKVCGILCEGSFCGDEMRSVAGIGINVTTEEFPAEIQGKAGSLFEHEQAIPKEVIAAAVWQELMDGHLRMPEHLSEYRARCLTLGREVEFMQDNERVLGKAISVGEDGALEIRTLNGTVMLNIGEALIRGADGSYY